MAECITQVCPSWITLVRVLGCYGNVLNSIKMLHILDLYSTPWPKEVFCYLVCCGHSYILCWEHCCIWPFLSLHLSLPSSNIGSSVPVLVPILVPEQVLRLNSIFGYKFCFWFNLDEINSVEASTCYYLHYHVLTNFFQLKPEMEMFD